jgi:hypothetical protein
MIKVHVVEGNVLLGIVSVRSNNCLFYRVKVPSGELSVHPGSSRERRLSNQGS